MREEEKESWEKRLKDISDNVDMFVWDYEGVRGFMKYTISQALQAQRAELLEKMPKRFDEDRTFMQDYMTGYNDCLSEVKKIIEGDKEK
jgi:hypothetical protein